MNTHRFALLRQLLLAAVVATGFGTVWAVLAGWVGNAFQEARAGKSRMLRESIVATADGTPLIESLSYDDAVHTSYRDLSGREHAEVKPKDQAPAMFLYGENFAPRRMFFSDWRNRIKVFMNEREPEAIWYFVHDGRPQGAGYFVGYEHMSNRLIGYIGLSGFRAERPPSEQWIPVRGKLGLHFGYWSSATLTIYNPNLWFEQRLDPWDVPPRLVHVPSGNLLRLVDLDAHTIATVFETPAPIVSVSIPDFSSRMGGPASKELPILVWAGQTIYRLDHHYKLIGTFAVPADVERDTTVTWFEAESGGSVVECVRTRKGGEGHGGGVSKPTVYLIAADGTVRQSFEVSLKNGTNGLTEEAQTRLWGLACPGPAILVGAELLMAMENPTVDLTTAFRGPVARALAMTSVISLLLAAVTWWRGRAFGFSQREEIAWAVFVLLFGVPGFAGFLLHRRWPAREVCPHCRARSVRDRDRCAACGTPFPEAALKGTEIFA